MTLATHPYRKALIARAHDIRTRAASEPGVWVRHACDDETVRPVRIHDAHCIRWMLYLYPVCGDGFSAHSYVEVAPPADAGTMAQEIRRASERNGERGAE